MGLSFVTTAADDSIAVNIAPTGKTHRDFKRGGRYARELAHHVNRIGDVPLFTRVLREMVADPSHVGAGFVFELALIASESA